jgi:para-nitrobenzyl esterase
MVWIHGGGFTGSATSESTFDGTRFAQQGVVLVSTAYRLGVFGFLAHPELDRESGKDSGNYGLQAIQCVSLAGAPRASLSTAQCGA